MSRPTERAAAAMSDLRHLKEALSKEVGSTTAFAFINTRLILRTGVDLQRDDQDVNPERLAMVWQELRAMGLLNGGAHE